MALILHSSPTSCCASAAHKQRHFLHLPRHKLSKSLLLPIKSQKSSSSEPPISTQSTTDDTSSTTGGGKGGSGSENRNKSKKKGRKVIRRAPVETPKFVPKKEEEKVEEQSGGEKAFLLAWSGLGSIIIIEGLLLAASGFLPEEWDKKIVKYLYPAFTPTVFLFVAGTVVYGVLKYLQNEKPQSSK